MANLEGINRDTEATAGGAVNIGAGIHSCILMNDEVVTNDAGVVMWVGEFLIPSGQFANEKIKVRLTLSHPAAKPKNNFDLAQKIGNGNFNTMCRILGQDPKTLQDTAPLHGLAIGIVTKEDSFVNDQGEQVPWYKFYKFVPAPRTEAAVTSDSDDTPAW